MAITVIVELRTKPGRREDLARAVGSFAEKPGAVPPGMLGVNLYGMVDDPDVLVEISDWESVEAHDAAMQQAAGDPDFAAITDILAAPFKQAVVRQLAG